MTHSKSLQIIADALKLALQYMPEFLEYHIANPNHEQINKALALIPDIEAGLRNNVPKEITWCENVPPTLGIISPPARAEKE